MSRLEAGLCRARGQTPCVAPLVPSSVPEQFVILKEAERDAKLPTLPELRIDL